MTGRTRWRRTALRFDPPREVAPAVCATVRRPTSRSQDSVGWANSSEAALLPEAEPPHPAAARHQIRQEADPGAALLRTDPAGLCHPPVAVKVARRKTTARAGLRSAACRRRRRYQRLPRQRGQPTSAERCGRISKDCAAARPRSQTSDLRQQHVAFVAYRADQFGVHALIELAPQPADLAVDRAIIDF